MQQVKTNHLPLLMASVAGLVLILMVSVVQGLWTQRWSDSTSEEILAFADAYDDIPLSIGDWQGERNPDMDKAQKKAAGAIGHFSAVFNNPSMNHSVSVYMIAGASRDVSVHTPDACYPGAGFTMEGEPQPYTERTEEMEAEFTTTIFNKDLTDQTSRLRIFWAWNATGSWESPSWPRLKYGGRMALNKIYLISSAPPGQDLEESPSLEFAKLFIPEVNKLLFPKAEPLSTETKPKKTEDQPVENID